MTADVWSDVHPLFTEAETIGAAAAEGRRLALEGVAGVMARPGDNPVEALAHVGIPRLQDRGATSEVVRSRRGCLVVRTVPRTEGSEIDVCAFVQAWLSALPVVVLGESGTVVESSCSARGGRACMHTLMWQEPTSERTLGPERSRDAGPVPGAPSRGATGETLPISTPAAGSFDSTGRQVLPASLPLDWRPEAHAGRALRLLQTSPASLRHLWRRCGPERGASAAEHHAAAGERPRGTATAEDGEDGSAVRDVAATPVSRRSAWLRRRGWLVAIGVFAGCLGGLYTSSKAVSVYTASSVMVVHANGATAAASTANGAEALAVTYAALIPDDQALIRRAAAKLGMTDTAIAHSLAVQAESGTSLVDIRFSATSPAVAERGANDVARLLSSVRPPGRAIAGGSVAMVASADAASPTGTLHKYGLPLGVLGGLVVGAGAALVAERTDRRIDDLDAFGSASGCLATVVPGGLTAAELARSLQRSGDEFVTVVPVRDEQRDAANGLACAVREAWPSATGPGAAAGAIPEIAVSPPFADVPQAVTSATGQIVLVVGAGEKAVAVREVVERLRLLGCGPAWAVLVPSAQSRSGGRAR